MALLSFIARPLGIQNYDHPYQEYGLYDRRQYNSFSISLKELLKRVCKSEECNI